MPTARSIARAGARSEPSVTSRLRGLMSTGVSPCSAAMRAAGYRRRGSSPAPRARFARSVERSRTRRRQDRPAAQRPLGWLRKAQWPPGISSGSMPRRSRTTPRIHSGGKKRSSMQSRKRVGTSGQAASGHGSLHRRAGLVARRAGGGQHVGGHVVGEQRLVAVVGQALGGDRLGACRCWPTTRRRSRPGRGIIAVTSTMSSTGTRSATSGAVKPPSDWATSTRSSRRSPMASTTASAYSAKPAASSSHGRSSGDDVVAGGARARPRPGPSTTPRPPARGCRRRSPSPV